MSIRFLFRLPKAIGVSRRVMTAMSALGCPLFPVSVVLFLKVRSVRWFRLVLTNRLQMLSRLVLQVPCLNRSEQGLGAGHLATPRTLILIVVNSMRIRPGMSLLVPSVRTPMSSGRPGCTPLGVSRSRLSPCRAWLSGRRSMLIVCPGAIPVPCLLG